MMILLFCKRRLLPAGLALALFIPALQAQDRVDTARATSLQAAPATLPGEQQGGVENSGLNETAPGMEGDAEYGVQRILYRRSNWEPWNFRIDAGGFYTSNVALVEEGEVDDFYLQSGATISYTPQIRGGLFARALLSDQIFRYADADVFDFDLLRAQAGLIYAFPRAGTAFDPLLSDLLLFADYGYYRIAEPWDWSEDSFDNHGISLGAQKTWRFSRGHSVSLGLSGDWSLDASRPEPQRDEYAAVLAYRIKWTSALESVMAYRAALYDYQNTGRTDFNQVVSVGLGYKITDWLSANASVSGVFNNSNRELLDYKALNTGASLFLAFSW